MLTDKDRERASEREEQTERERGRERAREREKLREDTSRRGEQTDLVRVISSLPSFWLYRLNIQFLRPKRRKAQVYEGLLSFPCHSGTRMRLSAEGTRKFPRRKRDSRVSFREITAGTRFSFTFDVLVSPRRQKARSGSAEKEQAFIRASFSRASAENFPKRRDEQETYVTWGDGRGIKSRGERRSRGEYERRHVQEDDAKTRAASLIRALTRACRVLQVRRGSVT